MPRPAALALVLALAACDWPVPDAIGARETPSGPWPSLAPDAVLGLGPEAGTDAEDELPDAADLAGRADALRERAAALAVP